MTAKSGPPALRVSPVGAQPLSPMRSCEVVWQIENLGLQPVELLESWLPHGQFRAAREAFVPSLVLPPGGAVRHSRRVEIVVASGGLVQNAFLILRVLYQGDAWRIFTRMHVESALDGSIHPIVEAITASRVSAEA